MTRAGAAVIESGHAPPDTGATVLDAQSGDEQALSHLLAAHLPLLYNVVGRALNGHPDVDDLVQETLVQVIRGLPTLRDPERFRSWAVSIAYRQIQQHQRRRRENQRLRQEHLPELPDPTADFAERTVTELMLTGQRQELAHATRWLDDPQRELLALWWQEAAGELSRAELSAVLDVSPRHAAVRLQRMRRQLDTARTVVRALRSVPRCSDLDTVLRDWDGGTGPLWRKRLFRHVRDCPACSALGRGLVPPEKLLLGASTLALPVMAATILRTSLEAAAVPGVAGPAVAGPAVATGHSVFARVLEVVQSKLAIVTATAVVAAGGGVAYIVDLVPQPDRNSVTIVNPPPTPQVLSSSTAARPSPRTSAPATVAPTRATTIALTGVSDADLYVAPDGSPGGDGTRARPYGSLAQAVAQVRPGQTIALRGGTYRPSEPTTITTDGTTGQRITVSNYRNERPVIDAAGIPADQWAITQEADYWTVQGLELKNSGSHAYVCLACRYTIFRRLSIHDNVRSSLTLRNDGTIGNQVLDSDFYNNHAENDGGSGGIGLGIKFGNGDGNVVRGNRAFNNADDGFNLGDFNSPVTLESNWAYGNGENRWDVPDWRSNANGFSLGGGSPSAVAAHIVRNNAAWNNIHDGFADQNNPITRLSNNTAFRNGSTGFNFTVTTTALTDNVAVGNDSSFAAGPGGDGTGNSWNGGDWPADRFASTDPIEAQGPRRPDGALPRTDYLSLDTPAGATLTK